MQIQTTRFGTIDIKDSDVLTFNEGLLGFTELRKFVLLDDPDDEIFVWLQSCERGDIAFPLLEPELFFTQYKVKLSKVDLESVSAQAPSDVSYFSIVTIPEDVALMSLNLKAPVIVNSATRKAKQTVAQENDLQIKYPIFNELQKRFVQNPEIKRAQSQKMAVRLTPQRVSSNKEINA